MKQLSVKSRYVCIALLILFPVLCQAEDLYAMGLSLDFNFQRELIYLVSLLLSFVLGCVAGVTHGLVSIPPFWLLQRLLVQFVWGLVYSPRFVYISIIPCI